MPAEISNRNSVIPLLLAVVASHHFSACHAELQWLGGRLPEMRLCTLALRKGAWTAAGKTGTFGTNVEMCVCVGGGGGLSE